MARNLNDPANWLAWLRAIQKDADCSSCQIRGVPLGMLTGQDKRAMLAFASCLHLYAASDADGSEAALDALCALRHAMQKKCWPFARELIAQAMDWPDRERVWWLLENRPSF